MYIVSVLFVTTLEIYAPEVYGNLGDEAVASRICSCDCFMLFGHLSTWWGRSGVQFPFRWSVSVASCWSQQQTLLPRPESDKIVVAGAPRCGRTEVLSCRVPGKQWKLLAATTILGRNTASEKKSGVANQWKVAIQCILFRPPSFPRSYHLVPHAILTKSWLCCHHQGPVFFSRPSLLRHARAMPA